MTGLAAEGCETSTLARPSWWHLLPHWHCYPSVSAIPASCCPWECTELDPSSRRLPLPPRFAAHIKPNMFLRAFQFLMKTSAFTLSLASARQYFGHRRCSASPGIGDGSVFPLALMRWGMLLGAGRAGGTAAGSRHIPIPGSTSRCQLCQPTPQHGTGLGGIPASHGCWLLVGKETPGNPNRLSQGEKQTALDLESTSTSRQSSLSSLPSNQQGFSSNPTFPT